MGIKGYLAMTAAEFSKANHESSPAWMSCHFSLWGEGLTNLPVTLPQGSMVILDDSNPPNVHDVEIIKSQMGKLCQQLNPECILLDFQKPGNSKTAEIALALVTSLPCPVGISQQYAKGLSCPVLLDCPQPSATLRSSAAAFGGRELWLELAPERQTLALTEEGCHITEEALSQLNPPHFFDQETASCYHWTLTQGKATFYVQRDLNCLQKLLLEAEQIGISRAVGLYQQLGADFFYKKAPTG